ncbi:LuxR C-terminal-related transcriptional regulator [Variovorax sp. KK3]|uniref:LuxR C-terminal-related transcriptional regulator n=1 Tax=Variovorax sp. KK3 TaxID=1855728 RepID=UPI00097C67EE|nr:LuxR C-terminal-related transcriptional regulator [Variovorax sp. KK3]
MQSHVLVKAKIEVPHFRSGLIQRTGLEQRLGEAMAHQRLVLLVAPAGYGKTAALSRQLQRLPTGCVFAWLTADEDDDLQRFLSHLIEALEPLDPPWRLAPEALFDLVARGRLRETAAALLRTLHATDAPEGGVIVIDDLHAVADARVFEFLDHLLDDLPQRWTMAIATRTEPPLTLRRWRVRREMTEFDEQALEFSRSEVGALCRHAMGSDDPSLTEQLLSRTKGWAAGLCLSLEARERFGASAAKGALQNRRYLFEFLASEVLAGLPQELQDFLLRCSVLSELSLSRCSEVSGSPHTYELLEDIERRRLFVSVLNGDELTMRLHDLFRDFLEERLRRVFPLEVPALLRVAAAGEPDPVRRTLMHLRAGAWDAAQESLGNATPDLLTSDGVGQVLRIVDQFPSEIRDTSAVLAYVRGLCAWPQSQHAQVAAIMEHAASGFDALQRHDEAQRARAMQALGSVFCGRVDEARRLGQRVRARPMDLETETLVEMLDFWIEGRVGSLEGPGRHLGNVVALLLRGASAEFWARCMPHINVFINRPGVSAHFQRLVDGARAAAGGAHWALQAAANVTEGWLLLWQGRTAELSQSFQRVEDDARWLGQPVALQLMLLNQQLNRDVIVDDRDAARIKRDKLFEHIESIDPSSDVHLSYVALGLRASIAIEDWPTVRMHLPRLEADAARGNPSMSQYLLIFKATLALEERRIGEALAILRELAANPDLPRYIHVEAMARTRLALAELADGSPGAAWRALQPLLERAAIHGNVGELLITGVQGLRDLSAAAWGDVANAGLLADLRRWVDAAVRSRPGPPRAEADLAIDTAGLSPRELEVLALLTEGQSNKLIARCLDLSPHTVKRHVARILERLDLTSRAQAANWYREHLAA